MTRMNEATAQPSGMAVNHEELYYCERHGVMNKATDLKEKADQIAKQT